MGNIMGIILGSAVPGDQVDRFQHSHIVWISMAYIPSCGGDNTMLIATQLSPPKLKSLCKPTRTMIIVWEISWEYHQSLESRGITGGPWGFV